MVNWIMSPDNGLQHNRRSGLFFFRLVGFIFSQNHVPEVFFRLQPEDANLIRFSGADLPDPSDAKFLLAPQAVDFDDLARSGKEADAIEASAVLAEVDSVGTLLERMALWVGAFDDQ